MKIVRYFKESYAELMHKVTWPSWEELQGSAIVVMIATVIIALIVAGMDYSFKEIMEFIYQSVSDTPTT
ncbi:MAG: preprotein translocase subunit SecE [Bacteroidales bacterium]|nr:preprotein translocase subunit SecE [Bacteroidales bacterium]